MAHKWKTKSKPKGFPKSVYKSKEWEEKGWKKSKELKGIRVLDSERPKPSTEETKKMFSKKAIESRKPRKQGDDNTSKVDFDYLYGDWMKNKKLDLSKPVPSKTGKKIKGVHPIGDRKKKIKRKHPIGDRSKKISGQLM